MPVGQTPNDWRMSKGGADSRKSIVNADFARPTDIEDVERRAHVNTARCHAPLPS